MSGCRFPPKFPNPRTLLLVVPGYQLLRADRPDGRGYGGVAVLARDGIDVTPIRTALRSSAGQQAGVPLDAGES